MKFKTLPLIEIALIAIFTFIVVFLAATNNSFWYDESYSITSARESWQGLLEFYHHDPLPPLYFLILKTGFLIFGDTVFVAKMVSILPSVLTAVIGTLFLRKNFSNKAAVIFLLCFVASTNFILYSIEIRPYSWALFFVSLAFIAIWNIVKTKKRRWLLLFLLCAEGAAFTHYFAAVGVAFLYLVLLIYIFIFDKKELLKIVFLGIIAVLIFLPWAISLFGTLGDVQGNFQHKSLNMTDLLKYVYHSFPVGLSSSLLSKIATGLNVAIFLSVTIWYSIRHKFAKADIFIYSSLFCIFFIVLAGIAMSSFFWFFGRYLFPATGLLWIFFAIACNRINSKPILFSLSAIIVIFGILTFTNCFKKEQTENAGFQKFYNYAAPKIAPDDILIFPDKTYLLTTVVLTLFPHHTCAAEPFSYPFPNEVLWNLFKSKHISFDELTDKNIESKTAWIFVNYDENNPDAPNPRFIFPNDANIEDCGNFSYDFYRFKIYRTDSVAELAKYLPSVN